VLNLDVIRCTFRWIQLHGIEIKRDFKSVKGKDNSLNSEPGEGPLKTMGHSSAA